MKKIWFFLISFVLSFCAIGCSSNEKELKNKGNPSHIYMGNTLMQGDNASTYSYVNSYDTQLQLSTMQIWGYLGKAQLNQDKTFIKSGEGSLKIQVVSDPLVDDAPCIYQGMDQSPINGKALNDFTEVTHVCVDVYSAETETTRIGVGLVYKWNGSQTSQSTTKWIEVNPGWNKIVYGVNRETIIQTDIIADDGTTKRVPFVEYISFWFDRGETDKYYYFDDLKLYKTGTLATVIDDIREKDEICTFDQAWQINRLENFTWLTADLYPVVELNTDINYVQNNRGGSLKMTFPATEKQRFTGVHIRDAYLNKMDFTSYNDDDYLCFNFYTPVENPVDFVVIQLFTDKIDNRFLEREFPISAGKWMTVRLSIGELRKGPNPKTNINSCKIMQVASYTKSTVGVLYVDNIRVEVAG